MNVVWHIYYFLMITYLYISGKLLININNYPIKHILIISVFGLTIYTFREIDKIDIEREREREGVNKTYKMDVPKTKDKFQLQNEF